MFWVQLVVVLAVLGGIAWVAAGRGGGISPAYSDRPDLALPPSAPLSRSDVDGVRFSVGLRGYRMDEVDEVLDRLAFEIAERDAYIAELGGTATPPKQADRTASERAGAEQRETAADAAATTESAADVAKTDTAAADTAAPDTADTAGTGTAAPDTADTAAADMPAPDTAGTGTAAPDTADTAAPPQANDSGTRALDEDEAGTDADD